jgi:glycosyltransferase involved in cell wall biosynthesis
VRILQIDRQRQWAGQQVRTFALAERLRARGDEVHFACMPGSMYETRAKEAGFPLTVFGMRARSLVTSVPRLARYLRRARIELVDAHGAVDHNIALFGARLLGRAAVVRTKHNHTHLHGRISRFTYGRLTRRIIAVSDFTRRILLEDGIAPERIDLVYDGIEAAALAARVDAADRRAARARFGVPEGAFAVGTTSRPSPRKGIEVAAGAVAALARERPGSPFLYVCAGGHAEVARHWAVEKGGIDPARVVVTGFVSPVADLFPALDAFLLPSREEALGMALLEAMAAGLPVVASAVGGVPEVVVDGESGLLVPPGDEAALARAIARLADEDGLARRLGAAARARILERHEVSLMAQRTRETYERALGG